jgi:hypothetical protein
VKVGQGRRPQATCKEREAAAARAAATAAAAEAERDAALARVGKVRQQQEAAAAKWAAGDIKAKARTPVTSPRWRP